MRIDRVKLIAEMARQSSGKSCTENSVKRVAAALGVSVESLMEQ